MLATLAALLVLQAEPKFESKSIDANGTAVKYEVSLPAGYDGSKAAPTILFLHGSGEQGDDGHKQATVGLGPAVKANPAGWAPYLVIYPQKPRGRGGWMEHEKLILDIVEKTKKEYKVDEKRLYLTGLSMGGYATWALACKYPTMFAAAAPICGGGNPAEAAKIKDLPIWNFHGDKDTAVPIAKSNEMIEAVKAAGGTPQYTVYPGVGHNSWDKAYREEKLWEWFLKHAGK
jgi:predicted peptidase